MSWNVSLLYSNEKYAQVDNHKEGGTYAMGGVTDADLNITYNYSWFYHQCLDKSKGIDWLDGKIAKETILHLTEAVKKLGTRQYKDYWADTPGNAGYALNILLGWAKQHPDAVFEVR